MLAAVAANKSKQGSDNWLLGWLLFPAWREWAGHRTKPGLTISWSMLWWPKCKGCRVWMARNKGDFNWKHWSSPLVSGMGCCGFLTWKLCTAATLQMFCRGPLSWDLVKMTESCFLFPPPNNNNPSFFFFFSSFFFYFKVEAKPC